MGSTCVSPESRFSFYMKNAGMPLCIRWHDLNSYSNTERTGKVGLGVEKVISVSKENVNLKLVISFDDKKTSATSAHAK